MRFFRNQRKFLLSFLFLGFMAAFYLWIVNSDHQSRLQDAKRYRDSYLRFWHYLWTLNPAFSYVRNEGRMKDHLTNSNDTIVDAHSYTNKTPWIEALQKPATSPSEIDFLGDDYSTDDMPQTTCPSSIRKKVLQTDFAERFLFSVPVLQWAKHFSKPEYERLSHYSGAYGWGSVSIDVLNETLAILNASANWQMFDDWEQRKNRSQCIRCAVVGNAGILNGSKKGLEIDQSDYVFRCDDIWAVLIREMQHLADLKLDKPQT